VESYWDPEKKQPRQRRKYIGEKDPVTGKISIPRKGFTPRMAKDYGHIYLLLHMARLINKMGNTVLITNDPGLGREDILNLYRRKDVLEKIFDIIKNELESGRLKVSSKEAMEDRIFLTFLSMILYSEVSRVMKEKDLYKMYTLSEVFFELKKLRLATLTNRKSYLTEIYKRQRNLFEKFELPVPVVA